MFMAQRKRIPALVLALALVTAACTIDDNTDAPDTTAPANANATTTTESALSPAAPIPTTPVVSTLSDALPGFDMDAVAWEGYWYSRYNLGNLVMMSGLGLGFMPPMEGVMAMVAAVDQGPEAGEHVMLPANPALLKAVYAGGVPEFAAPFNGDPGDLSNFRWDAAAMDTRLLPAAQAQTIMKEVEWAKLFNNGGWAGGVTEDIGAMDRFKGMVMFASAKTQAGFALENLTNADGLFFAAGETDANDNITVVDDAIVVSDQYQMLQALSDVLLVLRAPEDFNSVYGDDAFLAMLGPAVDELFDAVVKLTPSTILDYDLGAQAMAWYAAATTDGGRRTAALDALEEFGEALVAATRSNVLDRARTIRGLLESARVSGNVTHLTAALDDFAALQAAYDPAMGAFAGLDEMTTWDVGDVLGALNSLRFNTGDAAVRRAAEEILVGFFEATINKGGLMRAVVPKEMEASPFEIERLPKDVYFGYPGIPMPGEAGGVYGSAAVDVAAIRFDPTAGWSVADSGFVTSATMHASNEMFWLWGFQSGFPLVPGTPGLTAGDGAPVASTGTVIEVSASEFAFDPTEFDLAAGSEVTLRLVNDGAILHNIDIPELGVFVEAEAGATAEVTFTVPGSPAAFTWFCSVPGHQEAGMEAGGTIGG